MKRIIGLYGKANCDKTTTLNNLIEKLAIATGKNVAIPLNKKCRMEKIAKALKNEIKNLFVKKKT